MAHPLVNQNNITHIGLSMGLFHEPSQELSVASIFASSDGDSFPCLQVQWDSRMPIFNL